MKKIVLASNNKKKIAELQSILSGFSIEVIPQNEFDIPEAIEDGLSFVENAIIKARNACLHSGLPAIADDSGLSVDVLDGAPGIYSARYAQEKNTPGNSSDEDNNKKLLENLQGLENRSAAFHCVMAFMRHAEDPVPLVCHGSWRGEILEQPRGENGFGYDPLFYLPEKQCTSAQLPAEIKNSISHRGKAIALLASQLEKHVF